MNFNLNSQAIIEKIRHTDRVARKFMILTVLFFSSVSPVFREDFISKCVGIVGVVFLTTIAGMKLFNRSQPPIIHTNGDGAA